MNTFTKHPYLIAAFQFFYATLVNPHPSHLSMPIKVLARRADRHAESVGLHNYSHEIIPNRL
jgi:hypothetical protein